MRLPSLLLMFALCLPAMAEATPGKPATGDESGVVTDLERFDNAGFTYCDARIVAQSWSLGSDLLQAKTLIGQKVGQNGVVFARDAVDQMRPAAIASNLRCNIHDDGLDYDDAARLAQTWGMDVTEAKATLERKLLNGYAGPYLPSAAQEMGGEGNEHDNSNDIQYFFSSHYRYCDAQLLARHWSVSVSDAKTSIGYKVRTNIDVNDYLQLARQQGQLACAFHENFSFEEGERLARAWGVPLTQAKTMAQGKLSRGNHEALVFALGNNH